MNKTHIFPLILIACNLGAAITYAEQGDVRKGYLLDCSCGSECSCDF